MKLRMAVNNFYIYTHHKPNSDIPFYVGKGYRKRAYQKSNRNRHWHNIVKKHGSFAVEFEFENINEKIACQLEMDMIKMWGRADLGLGPLVNMTDGGDGISGHRHSEETKLKIGIRSRGNKYNLGRRQSEEEKHKKSVIAKGRPGKKLSEEIKHKISITQKGKPKSEKHCRNISVGMKGKPKSEKHCRNISLSWSDERKRNHSVKLKGRKCTDEQNRINSISKKEWWRQRKLKESLQHRNLTENNDEPQEA